MLVVNVSRFTWRAASGTPVGEYVAVMRPYWLLFCVIGIIIAFIGTRRRKALFTTEESDEMKSMSNAQLWRLTIPAIFLLFAVIAGPMVNELIGTPLFGPLLYTIVTIALIYFCSSLDLNKSVAAMVDGSQYILTRLFSVGLFLTFINIIGETGAFTTIAGVVQSAPSGIVVPVAVLAGFLIGVPAGAYVGSILTLVLPVTVALGFTPIQIGMVAIGVGFGSQLSLVNITMQALSYGFQIPIINVSRGNLPYVGSCTILLLLLSFFV